jgi:apolipoprotein N-acyltransferase
VKTAKLNNRAGWQDSPATSTTAVHRTWSGSTLPLAVSGAILLWLAQPPFRLWPLAWIALVPWFFLILKPRLSRRQYGIIYVVAALYWAVTMQGIRHAHPAMFAAWGALAGYLAVYPLAWVALVRVASGAAASSVSGDSAAPVRTAYRLQLPICLSAPVLWVGLECIRNYFATGISAVMLGHSQADVAPIIQIADAWGSYGVSFVIVLVNAAIAATIAATLARRQTPNATPVAAGISERFSEAHPTASPVAGVLAALAVLLATVGYGYWRLAQSESLQQQATINIALIGRDEPIVFEQDASRELQIFDAYFRQSYQAARQAAEQQITLDAVVWPESMFTGALPWLSIDPARPVVVPAGLGMSESEFREIVAERQQHFQRRAAQVQQSLREATGQAAGPDLIVGCSVVSYNDPPGGHSGCVHIDPDGRVANWYAKMHLVMFGEYIPWINYLPWIDYVVPAGMGILPGDGPVPMTVGDVNIAPNVCIETAVERVPVNQVRELTSRGISADIIVNVTNDGWFDRTSIIEHHLRCSQLVAVACRRPVLIAANGGPTAWIDGSGRIVQRLANDEAGAILVSSQLDGRDGLYLRIGDWPARIMALACAVLASIGVMRQRTRRRFE